MLPSKYDPKVYEVVRMLPPGSHRYFYTYNDTLVAAHDQKKKQGPVKNLEKKEYLNLDKYVTLETQKKIEDQENAEKKKLTKVSSTMKEKLRAVFEKKLIEQENLDSNWMEVEIA